MGGPILACAAVVREITALFTVANRGRKETTMYLGPHSTGAWKVEYLLVVKFRVKVRLSTVVEVDL